MLCCFIGLKPICANKNIINNNNKHRIRRKNKPRVTLIHLVVRLSLMTECIAVV